ncbi:hypothetical protein ABGB17_30990 [Sphaerisporangium sp. B11E5]|uniref:hypothetical protein n=1 Tax=Sphaerisporangium sp. B11E5 TaxID=3153563 RepID=UPI00325D40B6
MSQTHLAQLPEDLQRELFTIFRLEIRYDHRTNTALIRITLTGDTIEGIATMTELLSTPTTQAGGRSLDLRACAADLMRAPGRIRTCGTRFRRAATRRAR